MSKKKKFRVVLVFMILTTIPVYAFGQMDGLDMNREFYEKRINHIIECCKSKVKMSSSKHKNINDTGEMALKKATFCENTKLTLIEEMVQTDLAPKDYKVDYFINSKFFQYEKNNLSLN